MACTLHGSLLISSTAMLQGAWQGEGFEAHTQGFTLTVKPLPCET